MVDFKLKDEYGFEDLLRIMDLLRAPGGCPWDQEQTHQSIRRNFIEETYEAVDAIDQKDDENLCEELGDVLLQVVFHAKIAAEENRFDIRRVSDGICKKLISRHPHIFSDVTASNSEEVLNNWEEIKKIEKSHKTYTQAMQELPKSLPALIYADKLQSRAKKSGFEFPNIHEAFAKLKEEVDELEQAISSNTNIAEELGDVLFAAAKVSGFAKVDPEEALCKTSAKFLQRFEFVEKQAGALMNTMDLSELDKLWEKSKTM